MRGLRTVVGGPIASSLSADDLKADHVVIGEAEGLIAGLARDLEQGTARPVYQAVERRRWRSSPLPDLSLIKMHRYSTMAVQYSRGCPFNCEFCDIIEIYGRRPRTKAVAQVLAELDQLRAAGWREAVFIVDDNFIGNKARAKELCVALAEWRSQYKTSFDFNTEASLNLADDPELMQLMKDAGFVSVFLGIETPDESGLDRQQQAAEHPAQPAGQRSHDPELRDAGNGRLHPRIRYRSRRTSSIAWWSSSRRAVSQLRWLACCKLCPEPSSFGVCAKRAESWMRVTATTPPTSSTSFPAWTRPQLVEGYRSVLKRIYSCEAYYERVKLYLSRTQPRPG